MFFFFITSKRTFKHISLIIVLSLFTAWLLFLKTYSHESAFSTATGPKVIYKGDTAKNKLHSRLTLVGGTKKLFQSLIHSKKEKLRMQPSFSLLHGLKDTLILSNAS